MRPPIHRWAALVGRRTVREVLVETLVRTSESGQLTAEAAETLILNLLHQEVPAAMEGARGYPCPHCHEPLSLCGQHGPYRRTDENQCPGCLRGDP